MDPGFLRGMAMKRRCRWQLEDGGLLNGGATVGSWCELQVSDAAVMVQPHTQESCFFWLELPLRIFFF